MRILYIAPINSVGGHAFVSRLLLEYLKKENFVSTIDLSIASNHNGSLYIDLQDTDSNIGFMNDINIVASEGVLPFALDNGIPDSIDEANIYLDSNSNHSITYNGGFTKRHVIPLYNKVSKLTIFLY